MLEVEASLTCDQVSRFAGGWAKDERWSLLLKKLGSAAVFPIDLRREKLPRRVHPIVYAVMTECVSTPLLFVVGTLSLATIRMSAARVSGSVAGSV